MILVLVAVLVLCLVGLPQVGGGWHSYGYYPSGIGLVLLVVLAVLLLSGRW